MIRLRPQTATPFVRLVFDWKREHPYPWRVELFLTSIATACRSLIPHFHKWNRFAKFWTVPFAISQSHETRSALSPGSDKYPTATVRNSSGTSRRIQYLASLQVGSSACSRCIPQNCLMLYGMVSCVVIFAAEMDVFHVIRHTDVRDESLLACSCA